MKIAKAKLKAISPYSQSKSYFTPKENKEQPQAYEERTWRNRMHANEEGYVFIPPMSFKLCLESTAQYLGEKIQGKGQATWTKHFTSGILVVDPLVLPVKAADVAGEWLFVPSDGKKGGGKRVMKCFPVIQSWEGEVTFLILDDMIDKQVFERYLAQAGTFRGIGRFRPEKGGYYGRFEVKSIKWEAA